MFWLLGSHLIFKMNRETVATDSTICKKFLRHGRQYQLPARYFLDGLNPNEYQFVLGKTIESRLQYLFLCLQSQVVIFCK